MAFTDTRRDDFLDVLKGIGIVLVYWGHSVFWGTLASRAIFCFHMPLFFFVSGVLFRPERIESPWRFLEKMWRGLLIPYLLFCYIGFVLRIDVVFKMWHDDALRELLRIVHGEGSNAIWFLMCLASVQTIAWMAWRYAGLMRTKVCGAVALVALTAAAQYVSVVRTGRVLDRIPFMLASVPCCMIFFVVGRLFRNRILLFGNGRVAVWRLIAAFVALSGLFFCLCYYIDGTLDLRIACFHIRHLIPCLLGIGCACLLARMIALSDRPKRVFAWLGRYSLCLFALELPVSHVLAKLTDVGFFDRMYQVQHTATAVTTRILIVLGVTALCARPMMSLIEVTRAFLCDGERKGGVL